jgi:hypothetical protein
VIDKGKLASRGISNRMIGGYNRDTLKWYDWRVALKKGSFV